MRFAPPPQSRDLLEGRIARHEIDAAVPCRSPRDVFFGDQPLVNELARCPRPPEGDPAPALDLLGPAGRELVDARSALTLAPRFAT